MDEPRASAEMEMDTRTCTLSSVFCVTVTVYRLYCVLCHSFSARFWLVVTLALAFSDTIVLLMPSQPCHIHSSHNKKQAKCDMTMKDIIVIDRLYHFHFSLVCEPTKKTKIKKLNKIV